ncbi:PAS domain-containing protein [Shimia haliotis]|uniref:PAS fold n=1 Tax=Shimia haliotis TaxID=1280847 RepID=A0A1I4EH87_9RHOB|nr:PAS domain-containing protein [Shimia haliotis]SFL04360.1 PAS fold [Shimia haliotis]
MFDSVIDFLIVTLGISALLLSLGVLTFLLRRIPQDAGGPQTQEAICIYRNGSLVEANTEGLRLLAGRGGKETNWRALRRLLAERFPDFPENQGATDMQDTKVLTSSKMHDGTLLTIDQWNDVARVTIVSDVQPEDATVTFGSDISNGAPYPIWVCRADTQIIWCNVAYENLAQEQGKKLDPEIPMLFEMTDGEEFTASRRLGLFSADGTPQWFDVTSVALDQDRVFFAVDANTAVDTELAQRNLVQTLSRTFAHLPTGLAVFDRDRRLVLFNPPLVQLSGLSPTELSLHPSITEFFDKLRARHIAPEPKRAVSWQSHVGTIIRAMEQGTYGDTWELPDGKTYRVSGRPQQDGAIALLIDDISAEMALTRRFRAEIEIAHAALDGLGDPVVLFSRAGDHLLCNNAYRSFWQVDPDSTFANYTIRDATALWEAAICDTPAWQDFKEAIGNSEPRRPWAGVLALQQLGLMHAKLTPISGGATMIEFRRAIEQEITQPA